jgi:hypothetical protein
MRLQTPTSKGQALTTNRIQHLDQLPSQQLLRRNRPPSDLGVHGIESIRHVLQGNVRHLANRAQRMVRLHPRLGRDVAVHVGLLMIASAHTEIDDQNNFGVTRFKPFFRKLLD